MKFHLDTDKCEDIQLRFNREDNMESNILDFCFGITALYTDFCMQLGLDAEKATSLLGVCQSCMTRNLEEFISNGVLDPDDEDDEAECVPDEEIGELEQGMRAAGFSEEDIHSIVGLVQDVGSMDAALEVLKDRAEEAGIDWTDFEDNEEDMRCSEEQMRKEASSRLTQLSSTLGLNPNVVNYWAEGCLYYSYLTAGGFMGSIDKIEYDPSYVDVVNQLESEYDLLVYHVIESGSALILLSVSNDADEWDFERPEGDRIVAYVYRLDDPSQSEFGDVVLSSLHGALVRVG